MFGGRRMKHLFLLLSLFYSSTSLPAYLGNSNSIWTLDGATVPYVDINGPHYQVNRQVLSHVYISMKNSGTSGSTTIQINDYRSGSLQASATASLSASSGNPATASATLSSTLTILPGDAVTVDVNSISGGDPESLRVEY